MELKGYNIEEQKNLVKYWNWYYSKEIRTLKDMKYFDSLVETNLDDLLRLMVLERYTDFAEHIKRIPENHSLCNMIYLLYKGDASNSETKKTTVANFLKLVREVFRTCEFGCTSEEIVESALKDFEQLINKQDKTANITPDSETKNRSLEINKK